MSSQDKDKNKGVQNQSIRSSSSYLYLDQYPKEPAALETSTITFDRPLELDLDTCHAPYHVLREKVAIVGDATVGKTSLVQVFYSGAHEYPKNYVMTSSVELCVAEVDVPNEDFTIDLFLYDMAGQVVFNQRDLASNYWDGCTYIICVFDVSSRKSLQSCANWIQSVRSADSSLTSRSVPGILVANKIDLREGGIDSRSVIDKEEGQLFAKKNGLEYFECSAFKGQNVQSPFKFIADQSFKKYNKS
mmetsp:Transcript_16907/g.23181  ORF Transcript_16907/g.23181 Transcript_16907/m.23181 type:complete len:246 (-) Transcript_16907:581-1318(-)